MCTFDVCSREQSEQQEMHAEDRRQRQMCISERHGFVIAGDGADGRRSLRHDCVSGAWPVAP